MKMSEVFEKCELDTNGYFEAALEQDDHKLTAARHASNCHDELVEALEDAYNNQFSIKKKQWLEALNKAKGLS